jgi:hypothetical protein
MSGVSFLGEMEDQYISFHVRRSEQNYLDGLRKVTLFRFYNKRLTIVPGVHKSKETALFKELTAIQNKKEVEQNSFNIKKDLFSFMWRFRQDENFISNNIENLYPVDPHIAKKASKKYKKYQDYLRSGLVPGNIYLIPDTEIIFQNPHRQRQPYARRVLIVNGKNNLILIVPFSTRIDMACKSRDILFDSQASRSDLTYHAQPAIDNFPYKKMTKKSVLSVQAAQPLTREDFLGSALTLVGALRKETLQAVHDRLK